MGKWTKTLKLQANNNSWGKKKKRLDTVMMMLKTKYPTSTYCTAATPRCWHDYSHYSPINNHHLIATAVSGLSQSGQLRRITLTHSWKRSSPWPSSGGRVGRKGDRRKVRETRGMKTSVRIHLGFHCIHKQEHELGNAYKWKRWVRSWLLVFGKFIV